MVYSVEALMKKINSLVILTFIGPFVMTFFIALFILLMQFLWLYIDDLAGKGLDWTIILRLMFYVAITLVPLALPLPILLSSIMTFGNLAEHSELVACKSAGMALQRIMRPLIIVTASISVAAFYFSNNVLPYINLKKNSLLYDVKNQKPALLIKENVFYSGIDGYVIRVGKKDQDNKTIHNVMIYDHTEHLGNKKLILADKGTMVMSDDERYLILTLYNGKSYDEQVKSKGPNTRPLARTEFEKEIIRFDLSAFKMSRTDESLFKNNYEMLDLKQLSLAADSIRKKTKEANINYQKYNEPFYGLEFKTTKQSSTTVNKPEGNESQKHELPALPFTNKDFVLNFEKRNEANIVDAALNTARNSQSVAKDAANDIEAKNKSLAKHLIEWHRKFTLSFACLILFFIGAPLGAIIKKGGLGMPVVVSVIFFLTYHIISISGEKFAREGVIPAYKGMWMSSLILLPIGIFLTYKATTDSNIFDKDSYIRFLKNIFGRRVRQS